MVEPDNKAVASTIAMMEIPVQPYRRRAEELVDEYHATLTSHPQLEWIAPRFRSPISQRAYARNTASGRRMH